MSKIDIIEYCGDCSHRYYKHNSLYCEETGDKVDEYHPIPDDCPLEDSENVATYLKKVSTLLKVIKDEI